MKKKFKHSSNISNNSQLIEKKHRFLKKKFECFKNINTNKLRIEIYTTYKRKNKKN